MGFDPRRRAFTVGAGARLGAVYETLYKQWAVTIPGGMCPTVGVGGHVTGGGYGFLSRRFGSVVDHLEAVEVIVVDGSDTARAVVAGRDPGDPNHELWWMCAGGGGGNVGVVTRFWFRTEGATGTDPTGLLPNPPKDVLFSAVGVAALAALGAADRRGDPGVHQPNAARLVEVGLLQARLHGRAGRRHVRRAHPGRRRQPPSAVTLAGFVGGQVNAVDPADTAVAHRDSAFWTLFETQWRDPADDAANVGWLRDLYGAVFARTGGFPGLDADTDGCYVNNPDPDITDPAHNRSGIPWHTLYYKDNYPLLQRIKAAYDPHNVFRHAQSVTAP